MLGDAPGKVYTPEDWNPTTYEEAAEGGDGLTYMGTKALSERAVWAWVDAHKSASFDVVTVAPAGLFGPHHLRQGVDVLDLAHLNLSSQMLWVLASPTAAPTPFNSYHLGCSADVRDAAAALVAAVATPEASGKRFICAQRCH
jgi:NADPH-dependent methylglyoxal reductase